MDVQSQISQAMDWIIARIFLKDEAYIANNHQLRLKEDLMANSKQYFPIISYFEDKFDIFMDYHVFQFSATTIESAIDYVLEEYNHQKA